MRTTAFAAFNLLLFTAIICVIPVLIGAYVFRDAKRRGMNAVLWTLIAVFAPSLIGFIIYLLVRENHSNMRCPRCETTVTEQYVVCPKCGAKLRPSCPNCSAPVEPDWSVCPKCAQPLPDIQEDVVAPVQPKDKTLWKILAAIIIIPVALIFVLGIVFYSASSSGSSSVREVSFDEYFQDQELSERTKEYVQAWLDGLSPDLDRAYALMYERTYEPARRDGRNDYYYLVYIPGGGEAGRRGFGFSSGLFTDAFKLDLENLSGQDGLYCAATTSKKGGPKLKVTLDGRKIKTEMTQVDFNPTLYTIASEYDYSTLTNAAGDLYVEQQEKEMKPVLAVITEVEGGQEVAAGEFNTSDFLLNTVLGIHELHYLDQTPAFLDGYRLSDYFTLSVLCADTAGEAHYEETSDYMVIRKSDLCYLLEFNSDHPIEDTVHTGVISKADDLLVYEIRAENYDELKNLFN